MKDSLRATEDRIDALVRLAQRHLGMDVAFVAEFTGGRQVFRAVAGDATGFGFCVGAGPQLEDTYCHLMVDGHIPSVVPDTGEQPLLTALAATARHPIGAYVGVPVRLADGRLYGSFCGMSRTAGPDLNSRDAAFLSMLGELLADELADAGDLRSQHSALSAVLEHESIGIALQPVVDLVSGRCTSMEALARFGPGFGPPDVTLAVARKVGLGPALERLAARNAVRMLPHLAPDQSLAVNLSPDVAPDLAARLPDDLPLDRLILELTEHAAVECYADVRRSIEPLRERGLLLAIDDAGAGFASLRHIVELRPDIIKIDRSLLAGIDEDPARRSVLTTFVLLALDIGAAVVAEGVETTQELAAVSALGVDAVQGHLIALPSTDPDEVARWAAGQPLLGGASVPAS